MQNINVYFKCLKQINFEAVELVKVGTNTGDKKNVFEREIQSINIRETRIMKIIRKQTNENITYIIKIMQRLESAVDPFLCLII